MRKLWIFRGKGEFFLTVLAIGIPSYYGYTVYKQSKFNTSIVDHAIALLAKNPDVKQVLGAPLHYKSSTGSDYKKQDKLAYYSFRVGGPRGNLPVEVSASAMELSDVYNPHFFEEKKKMISQLQSELQTLKSQTRSQQASNTIKNTEQKIFQLTNELSQDKRALINNFYIVEDDKMQALISKRKQEQDIPEDWKMWSITNLQLNLPNGSQVIVVPQQSKNNIKKDIPSRLTYKNVYEKLNQLPQNLSQQEKQQYTKQKSLNVYNKYNTHRLVTFVFLGCAAMGALWYKGKYTLVPIQNSTLAYLAKTKFSANTQIPKLGKYFVTNNIQGGRKGSQVDAKIRVEGPKKSYIHILAKYQDNGSYKPESLKFVIENQEGNVQKTINLK